jgi:hypothetical protein
MKKTREKIQDLTMKNIIHTDEKELHFVWTQLRIATNNVVFLVWSMGFRGMLIFRCLFSCI